MSEPANTPPISPSTAILMSVLASTIIGFGTGCGTPSSPHGGTAEVTVNAQTVKDVVSVRLTVQSTIAHSTTLRLALMAQDQQYASVIHNLPVANDYAFIAEALDKGKNVFARGMATNVDVASGVTAKVIIYLNELDATAPFVNSSPLIDGVTLSRGSIQQGGDVALAATAHDPDPGQTATLSFSWVPAAACGTMSTAETQPGTDASNPSQSRATWTAPMAGGSCQITLTVTDTLGLADSVSFTITVENGKDTGPGSSGVTTVFNGATTILGLTANPGQLFTQGDNVGVVNVQASDPEGDTLTYAWSTPADSQCTFTFGTPSAASSSFAITDRLASAESCTFLVTISDGVLPGTTLPKNTSTASLTLAITEPVVVQTPPEFSVVFQSENFVSGGNVVKFAAVVDDPAGGPLTFAWSASAGSLPVGAAPESLELDPSFSAAATWSVPDGVENDADIATVTVTATSSTSNLQTAWTFWLVPANLQ
jgi:hypothetical protein